MSGTALPRHQGRTEYRVVDRDGRCTSTWSTLEDAENAMRDYDVAHFPERGPHRIQARLEFDRGSSTARPA